MSEVIGTYVVDQDEERLDRIAKRLYGSERGGAIERLLSANNGLAAIGLYDPRGTAIVVPTTAPVVANPAYTRPWE